MTKMPRSLAALCTVLLWMGCRRETVGTMIGGTYGTVLTADNSLLHQAGELKLYDFPTNAPRRLIWPSLIIRKELVLGNLILFNGAASDDRSWIYYPAFFAFAGTGTVVELSQPLARRIAKESRGATNLSFEITASAGDAISLQASQHPPIERVRPITLSLVVNREVILGLVAAAQTNQFRKVYQGVAYCVAQ